MSKQKKRDYYLVRCICDKEKIVSGLRLRNGNTRSCGCLMREINRKNCKILGKNNVGENNNNYLDGLSVDQRGFRKIVHERDKVCQYDNSSKCKGRLEARHLDDDRYNNNSKNGSLLCQRHHTIVMKGFNIWRPVKRRIA